MEKLEEYRWPLLKGLTISLFFLYFFIKGRFLGESSFYNRLDLAFGVYYYLLILYPLILTTAPLLKSKKKISVLKIRLFSGILFFFFASFYKLIKEMGMSVLMGTNLEQEFVTRAWAEMNLGGISTSIMHYLYFNLDIVYLYRIVLMGVGITSFILFTKMITQSIRVVFKITANRRERIALHKKEEELQNKISIKEKIDENMSLKKEKSLKQQEEKIQQEVDKFMMDHSKVEEEDSTVLKEEPIEARVKEKVEGNDGKIISLEELMEHARNQKETFDLNKISKEKNDLLEEAVEKHEKTAVTLEIKKLEESEPQELKEDLESEKQEQEAKQEKKSPN